MRHPLTFEGTMGIDLCNEGSNFQYFGTLDPYIGSYIAETSEQGPAIPIMDLSRGLDPLQESNA